MGRKPVKPGRAQGVDDRPEVLRALSPEDLAELAAAGSLPAFGELVARFELRLFNFLLRKVSSRTDAEDLAQEAFVRAWERIASFDRRWRFSTWLFTIASRLAVSHYRKQRPAPAAAEPDFSAAPEIDNGRDSELDQRLGRRLWALAATLGPEQHEALWLRYAEDLSIPDIAQVMRKSHVGVRVCLFRARQALAEKLEQQTPADSPRAAGRTTDDHPTPRTLAARVQVSGGVP